MSLLLTLAFTPALSQATPTDYFFDSGSVTLIAVLDDAQQTPVLTNPPVILPLSGDSVRVDSSLGSFGTLLEFALTPMSPITLDLDENVVTLDFVSIENALLATAGGATAALDGSGGFTILTTVSGLVSGQTAGGTPFGPAPLSSTASLASGSLAITNGSVQLNMTGVNLAVFQQAVGSGPDVIVKADFSFVGIVPEPGTALLLGVGLAGLALRRR